MVFLLAAPAVAKRLPPKAVPPAVSGGVRYKVDGNGRDQYVVAVDTSNENVLWRVKVFHVRTKFWVEGDVQWVYITDLRLVGGSLLVKDERSRCYSVELRRKRVKKRQCDSAGY